MARRHSGATVAHRDGHAVASPEAPDGDHTVARVAGVLEGVVDQVEDDLQHRIAVEAHGRQPRFHLDLDVKADLPGVRLENVGRFADHGADRAHRQAHLASPLLEPRELQDVVDEARQAF